MEIDNINRVHFIGIGGIGMSGLARLFHHEGKQVSGSDVAVSNITCGLEALGIDFKDSQTAENITNDIELVVYTEAMSHDQEEMVAARELGVPMINYFEALGLVANQYYLIAVAGTHGKTTTTAMIIDILEGAGLDPTAIVGSLRSKTGSNFRAGRSKYMIVEASEWRRDFLSIEPDVLIVTNIEYEHVDYFKDLNDVQNAFHELGEKVRENGAIVCSAGDPAISLILSDLDREIIDYTKSMDPLLKLQQPGLHNQLNAAAAYAASSFIGIEKEVIQSALSDFSGTWRRFEYKGETKTGTVVIDDYSHHPTEIKAALLGAREQYGKKKITIVYQPHTYTRIDELFDDFVVELGKADRVILVPIYAAREENTSGISSEKLSKIINEKTNNSEYIETFDEALNKLSESTKEDVILVMGAGTITELATDLVTKGN